MGAVAIVGKPRAGYNEKPRKPLKGQSGTRFRRGFTKNVLSCGLLIRTGHQMMLVSDMVLLWDAGFREHLEA